MLPFPLTEGYSRGHALSEAQDVGLSSWDKVSLGSVFAANSRKIDMNHSTWQVTAGISRYFRLWSSLTLETRLEIVSSQASFDLLVIFPASASRVLGLQVWAPPLAFISEAASYLK